MNPARILGSSAWILAFSSGLASFLFFLTRSRRNGKDKAGETISLALAVTLCAAAQVAIRQIDPLGMAANSEQSLLEAFWAILNSASYILFYIIADRADRLIDRLCGFTRTAIGRRLSGCSLFLCVAAAVLIVVGTLAGSRALRLLSAGQALAWGGFACIELFRLGSQTLRTASGRGKNAFIPITTKAGPAVALALFCAFAFFELLPQFLRAAGRSTDPEYIAFPLFIAWLAMWAAIRTHAGDSAPADMEDAEATGLTDRETEVAGLLAEGLSYREVGERLFVSLSTIQSHVVSIYAKLGVSNKVELTNRMRKKPK
jgi:DNA-binding CsgD family transcriptional regulator